MWIPEAVAGRIAKDFGGELSAARKAAVWLACVHDIGKAHVSFAMKVPAFRDAAARGGLMFPGSADAIPHSALSFTALKAWLVEVQGFGIGPAMSMAAVPGGHHGVPPSRQLLDAAMEADVRMPVGWRDVQFELLGACAA